MPNYFYLLIIGLYSTSTAACLKLLHNKSVFEKVRKKSMTGPGQPQTCSHPINA